MGRIQLKTAETIFFAIWCQAVPPAVHLWRIGDHFDGGFLLSMTSTLAALGVFAIKSGVRVMQKEGMVS